jgi:hypothetical protein
MHIHTGRRRFMRAAVAGAALGDLGFLGALSRAVASTPSIEPELIGFRPELDRLVRLIRETPREDCVAVFVREFERGLGYRHFMAGLFQAATQTGDLHQMAQIYGAHRTSTAVPVGERLLPMFWALDRVKQGQDEDRRMRSLDAVLPGPLDAEDRFDAAMAAYDGETAERAVVALARVKGGRYAMHRLWEYASRNLAGTLGHTGIGVASASRTLEAIGWRHAEPALRYMAHEIGRFRPDATFEPNVARVDGVVGTLPGDWAGNAGDEAVTRELFELFRAGDAEASCEAVAGLLSTGRARAGAVWDAVSLSASEVLFRHDTGGVVIGGNLVHAVTTTNALRYGFGFRHDDRTRLLLLLQAVGVTAGTFVGQTLRAGRLRAMHLLRDLDAAGTGGATPYDEVFGMLPEKGDNRVQADDAERAASDGACRRVFTNLRATGDAAAYTRAARSFMVGKATDDPHDIKFPAASFEDASLMHAKWRPYVLAASVHALHGLQSADAAVLVRARAAVG